MPMMAANKSIPPYTNNDNAMAVNKASIIINPGLFLLYRSIAKVI